MRALVIAHGHPDFSVGGAEIAAFNLFTALKRQRSISDVVFLGRCDHQNLGHGAIMMLRHGEYLWRQDIGDWFRLKSANPVAILTAFREFLQFVSPDVVFIHHFVHMGVEVLREIRRTLPQCKIVLTLHEYVAICNRNGQMVKNKTKRLCYRESIEDCHSCFPEYSPQEFWLRKHYIQRHFEAANFFVSPSDFLRQRYIDWGLPKEYTYVIENGQPTAHPDVANLKNENYHTKFAFFGQVTEYKGVDVLLQAMHLMPKELRAKISVEIHGANLESQGGWLQELVEKLRKPLIAEGVLRWVGPYEHAELPRRMKKVGWVLVPSIWWENSPMVIQEAFVNRRPVICAGIGGMAEKVKNGVDGLHFEVRNPTDLADKLIEASSDPLLWMKLVRGIRTPLNYDQCAEEYLKLVS